MLKKENLHSMYGILTYIDPFFNHPNVCVYGSPRRVVSGYIYIYYIYPHTDKAAGPGGWNKNQALVSSRFFIGMAL